MKQFSYLILSLTFPPFFTPNLSFALSLHQEHHRLLKLKRFVLSVLTYIKNFKGLQSDYKLLDNVQVHYERPKYSVLDKVLRKKKGNVSSYTCSENSYFFSSSQSVLHRKKRFSFCFWHYIGHLHDPNFGAEDLLKTGQHEWEGIEWKW